MSGKSYTMREMKAIVDYLTQHRAYGEIKGRKMWMEYANSKLTTRTWQSLKDTFVKRILPDITNPYYKLSLEQIASFRQGTDLETIINNKLEIQTIHGDSSSDTDKKDLQPSNAKNTIGDNDAGEDSTNHIRSSTDTVVIEPCYNTAEEIQKDLESPGKENGKKNSSPIPCSTKSIRDYITYSEPLTPMLQEVLHDFASEDEGDEPQMQIVEYPEPFKKNDTDSLIETLESENERTESNENANKDKNIDKSDNENTTGTKLNKTVVQESDLINSVDKSDDVQCIEDSEEINEPTTNKDDVATAAVAVNDASKNIDEKSNLSTKSLSNSNSTITDTLPNNQEAFKGLAKSSEKTSDKQDVNNLVINENRNDSRKRSKSEEITSDMTPEKRICTDKTRERNSSDRDVTAQDKSTTKLDSNNGKTEVMVHANSDGKTNNHKPKKLSDPRDVISENEEALKNTKIDESVCISDDNLPEIQQEAQDILIKTDEEASLMSEDRESSRTRKETRTSKPIETDHDKEVNNEIVILKSHSESTSDHNNVLPKKSRASLRAAHKMHRNRALANVFGFSSGAKPNQKKHKKNVKRLSSHKRTINTSSSEESTSETGTEFISPPRGRKNKQSRKYLKPKSARILSLEEEGGLFVMYGKKVYPVVKDGKLIKNYLTYTPDYDSEDEDSYWKLKYVEEKKKSDELAKLLKDNKKQESVPVVATEDPAPQEIVCEKPPTAVEQPKEVVEKSVEQNVKEPEKKDDKIYDKQPVESRTVKIQFMKDNETVQVEGHWSHIQPVLEQVVQILHKEPPPPPPHAHHSPHSPHKRSVDRDSPPRGLRSGHQTPKKQKISRDSTPVSTVNLEEDVNEKLNKIEEEIFQKIQERDLAESAQEDTDDTHVTKRRVGRPRTRSMTGNKVDNTSSPTKNPRVDGVASDSSVRTRRQSRTPKKNEKETPEKVTNKGRNTRKSSRSNAFEDDESSIKYKFPSPSHESAKNKATRKTATKTTKRK